ncbi:MAG: FAD-dependent oxidoreductase [Acidobacteriota bacterium]
MSDKHKAVCKLSEINDGEMKEIKVGETPVVLARVDGKCFALAAHCTHYGAPLADGALVGDRIVCPWHHACFHAGTGDMIEPPALDSLPSFPVRVERDEIFVDLPGEAADRRLPEMMSADPGDNRIFVIVGGGAAGYSAAQTLREEGFAGRIVIITREDRLPYDRPNLSKDYLQGNAEPAWMPLRPDEFFETNGIEFMLSKEVTRITAGSKEVEFADGGTFEFNKLLVATGGTPRKLDLPGSDLRNIFVLRSFDSADAIIAAVKGAQNVVVIGASFIGMEAASSLRQTGKQVTVVSPDRVPFEKVFGGEIGAMFRSMHEYNGVKFRLGSGVKGFEGDGMVKGVLLDNGETIGADLVIAGIGVRPATDFLEGFVTDRDGGPIADKFLCIGEDVYAAGDIVHFPDPRTGEIVRIEHWRTALQQGRTAAHNMSGKQTAFAAVPFFWTRQFDTTLNYVGHTKGWDEIIIHGDVGQKDFLAFYVKDHTIRAAAGMNRDRELALFEELMRLNRMPPLQELREASAKDTNGSGVLSAAAAMHQKNGLRSLLL